MLSIIIGAYYPALAHGYIIRAIPENRAILQRSPSRLQYWFSEALEPEFSSIRLRDQSGNVIADGHVDENDHRLLTLQVPRDLAEAAYIVELRPAFASDGHVVAQSRVFFIGSESDAVNGTGASDQAVLLEVVWRTALLSSTLLLWGVYALYLFVLVPVWGSRQHRAGLLPPRVMIRLNWIVAIALLLSLAANFLALIQQTMVFFNVGAQKAIADGLWSLTRIGSRFGDVWNFRALFLLIALIIHAASITYRRSHPRAVYAFWAGNIWIIAIIIGTFSLNSHAAGSLIMPWIALLMNWLHGLSAGFWAGGVAALILVLPVALAPYKGEKRVDPLISVTQRFSRYIVAAAALVITTGVYNSSNWFYAPDDVFTSYGTTLLLKALLVLLLLCIGGLHHLALRPQLARQIFRIQPIKSLIGFARTFHYSLRIEVFVAVLILVLTGFLTATPVPEPEFAQQKIGAVSATQIIDGLEITTAIIPGGPGVNTYDITLRENGEPAKKANAQLQLVNPERDERTKWLKLEETADGLYVASGDEIHSTGRWIALVDSFHESGKRIRSAVEWDISEEAAVLQSRPMGAHNIIPLIGVCAIIGWILYPAARRFTAKLDLRPENVLTAGGAVAFSVALIIMGARLIKEHSERYQEVLRPAPAMVNPVLPDAASLERGEILYAAHCFFWQQYSRDFRLLRNQLANIRDEDLYRAITSGWRNLPPCGEDLTEQERWDIVNYFRVFNT